VIYDIATNAANEANTLTEGIRAIMDTEYQCRNTTESNYVRDTAATYDLLDSCLKYGVPTTSASPVSVTTTGVTISTQSDSTNTDDSTSFATTDAVSSAAPTVAPTTKKSV